MKEKFIKCMRYIYPEGISNQFQIRDLIKVFSMGYLEAMEPGTEQFQKALEEIKPIKDFNWWPDTSWHWWK